MRTVGAVASLALPLIILPALVGGIIRWWLKTKLQPKIQVGVAAGALYMILLSVFGGLLGASDLAGAEGFMALSFLLLFFGMLGVPIAVGIALRVRRSIARDAIKTGA